MTGSEMGRFFCEQTLTLQNKGSVPFLPAVENAICFREIEHAEILGAGAPPRHDFVESNPMPNLSPDGQEGGRTAVFLRRGGFSTCPFFVSFPSTARSVVCMPVIQCHEFPNSRGHPADQGTLRIPAGWADVAAAMGAVFRSAAAALVDRIGFVGGVGGTAVGCAVAGGATLVDVHVSSFLYPLEIQWKLSSPVP